MTKRLHSVTRVLAFGFCVLLAAVCFGQTGQSDPTNLDELLARVSTQVTGFLDQFSDVKCTEQVEQEKFGKDGKVELREQSTFDYLVILTNDGGELSLNESRLALHDGKRDKKNTPLLVSNGFATLFLIFHPYYLNSFKFTLAGEAVVDGRPLTKISFEHIAGMRSPAALALRGRDYPLELFGMAWIDPKTGVISRLEAGVENTLEDVGLRSLRSEVEFAPSPFKDMKQPYWFPVVASVEVETPRQHWRNTHRFTDYKQFSVSTEEQVASK